MQLHSTFIAFSALAAAVSGASIAQTATWNEHLKIWEIGAVSSTRGDWAFYRDAAPYAGRCNNVPEGEYACGSFEDAKSMPCAQSIAAKTAGWNLPRLAMRATSMRRIGASRMGDARGRSFTLLLAETRSSV